MKSLYRTAAVVTIFSTCEHCLGFMYRIILSRVLGSEGLGVYQAALTMFAVFLTASASGLPITLSRVIANHRTRKNLRGEQSATAAAIAISLLFSVPITLFLFLFREQFSRVFSDARCADLFYIFLISLSFTSIYAIFRGCFWGNKRFFAYSVVELIEEIIMIATGVFLLLCVKGDVPDINKAAIAVLISYACSFTIATVYFIQKGGRLRSPRGEFWPLLKSSMPVTAMRTSSSLVSSLVSLLFPLRLVQAGISSARAMSEYGIVYGMVMPVMTVPSTLIGSIALVLVPELAECFYRGDKKALSKHVERALNSTLLIAGILVPFSIVCGEEVGVFLYSNAKSGLLIRNGALMLLPMSVTMISTSLLNSLNCEKHTLLFFLGGAAIMLLCTWLLPPYLGSGALLVGMAGDYAFSAICSLVLLRKKTGKLRSLGYFLRLIAASLPVILIGMGIRALCIKSVGTTATLALCVLAVTALELGVFALFKLYSFQALLSRFFHKKRVKTSSVPLTIAQK